MFQSAAGKSIGLKNIEACQKSLAKLDIAIVAQHCGGNQGRRMSLFSDDGKVIVEIVGQEPIEL